MKFLVLLLGLSFALATANPILSQNQEAVGCTEDSILDEALESDKQISLEEVQKRLKERFDEVLNKIKEAIAQGKALREGSLEKLRELGKKLKDVGFNFDDHSKEILEKGKEFLKRILEKLGIQKRDVRDHAENILMEAEGDFDIGNMKDQFNELVKKVKDAFEQGKNIKDALEKLQTLQEKLKSLNIDLGEKGKEYLEILKEKVKDYWKKLKENFGMKRSADIDVYGILEELKHLLNEKLRELGFEFDDHSPKTLKSMKAKNNEYFKSIFEELGFNVKDIDDIVLLEAEGDFNIGHLKDKFNELVNKIKDAFEQGKSIKDALEKLQDFQEKLKLLNIDLGENGKEYLELLKQKVKDYWNKLKEKLGMKRSADIDVFGMLEELKQAIKDNFDGSNLREIITKALKKASELRDTFLKIIEENKDDRKELILSLINRLLGKSEPQYSIADIFEKIKNYFKDLNIDLKEKFIKFGEWVKSQYAKGLEKGKTQAENVKKIAKEFLKDSQKISKEIAQEALDFFQEYKEDLGRVYDDIVEKVKEIRKN